MLLEMNDKAMRLVKLMKQGIVEFSFEKMSTGKIRKAHGTLKRDLIPPEAQRKRGRPRKRPDYLVIYYDTDKKAIRSFKDELLKRIISTPVDPGHSTENDNSKNEEKSSDRNEKSIETTSDKNNNKENRNI